MKNIKQYLINQQLLMLSQQYLESSGEDITYSVIENGQIIEKEISHHHLVEAFIAENKNEINLLSINNKKIITEEVIFLLEKIVDCDLDKQLMEQLAQTMTKKQLNDIPKAEQKKLIMSLSDQSQIMFIKKLFELGYDFQQGEDDTAIEVYAATSADIETIEFLLTTRPDIDITKKYKVMGSPDKSLLEFVEEELKEWDKGQRFNNLCKIQELIKEKLVIHHFNHLNTIIEPKPESMLKAKI